MNIKNLITALLVVSVIGATAQLAKAQTTPTYATPTYAAQDQQIHGRVVSFDEAYSLQVRDDQGYVDNVELHQGTIINPTGISLSPGMVVAVDGYNAGSYFAANEIDTPYTLYSGVPFFLNHPWDYYGPTVSLNYFFGHPGWWHGGYRAEPVVVNRGVYVQNHAPPYRGGAWHGHDYVAPPAYGGYAPHAGAPGYGGYAPHAGTPAYGGNAPHAGAPAYGGYAPHGGTAHAPAPNQGGARGGAGHH